MRLAGTGATVTGAARGIGAARWETAPCESMASTSVLGVEEEKALAVASG